MEMAILEVRDLSIQFGGLKAVDNFNINIEENELIGLIGPNGAGKTTIFNLLTGVYVPTEGSIKLNNVETAGKKPSDIVLLGSSRTFQNIRLFNNMTVAENIKIAYNNQMSYGLLSSIFNTKKYRKEEAEAQELALDLLDVFDMKIYAEDLAKNLPYGKQRKLEICRALATNPKILLLDEPAAGMNPQETDELMDTIQLIKDKFKISILLIEHDMKLVMGICERLVVIDYGKLIAKGNPSEIKTNSNVIKAYLGE
jgi:branched-chain amino acid transport system ATP-binding protein